MQLIDYDPLSSAVVYHLQNLTVPNWATHIAIDKNGDIYTFAEMPRLDERTGETWMGDNYDFISASSFDPKDSPWDKTACAIKNLRKII